MNKDREKKRREKERIKVEQEKEKKRLQEWAKTHVKNLTINFPALKLSPPQILGLSLSKAQLLPRYRRWEFSSAAKNLSNIIVKEFPKTQYFETGERSVEPQTFC